MEETDIDATGKRKACFFFISVNPIIHRREFDKTKFLLDFETYLEFLVSFRKKNKKGKTKETNTSGEIK